MNNEFLNKNISKIVKKLNQRQKLNKELVEEFGNDFVFNYPDREISVVDLLKKAGIKLFWNGGKIGECDAFGFLSKEQRNDEVEFKSHVQDFSVQKKIRVSNHFEFDKQENGEKRIRTRNIGGLVLSIFDKNRDTIYPSYVISLSLKERNSIKWENLIKEKQDVFLNRIKKTSDGSSGPRRQSIGVTLKELFETFSEDDIRIYDKDSNIVEISNFKKLIGKSRRK